MDNVFQGHLGKQIKALENRKGIYDWKKGNNRIMQTTDTRRTVAKNNKTE